MDSCSLQHPNSCSSLIRQPTAAGCLSPSHRPSCPFHPPLAAAPTCSHGLRPCHSGRQAKPAGTTETAPPTRHCAVGPVAGPPCTLWCCPADPSRRRSAFCRLLFNLSQPPPHPPLFSNSLSLWLLSPLSAPPFALAAALSQRVGLSQWRSASSAVEVPVTPSTLISGKFHRIRVRSQSHMMAQPVDTCAQAG